MQNRNIPWSEKVKVDIIDASDVVTSSLAPQKFPQACKLSSIDMNSPFDDY